MKNMRMILIFMGLYLLIGGLSGVSAQQVVGNYNKLLRNDAGALSAARFAVKHEKRKKENRRLSLASIERAESQVVAGTNYKICLKVINGGKIENVTAFIFRSPKNKFSLTGWEKGDCEIK